MSKNILYIEDSEGDFDEFQKILQEEGYNIIPENFADFQNLYENRDVQDLNQRISILKNEFSDKLLENNLFEKIDLILLDINLLGGGSTKEGLDLLSYLRNCFEERVVEGPYKYWGRFVPVIALTKFQQNDYELEFKKRYGYLRNFVEKRTVLLSKTSRKKFFIEISNSIELMNNIKSSLIFSGTNIEKITDLIEQKFGVVIFTLENNHSETIKMLQTLFLTSYSGLDKDKQSKLIKEYEYEIKKIINDDDKFQKLTQTNRWKDFKEAFAEIGKSGGIETFTNTVIDILNEAKVFESFPPAKVLSIGIKGIVSLASKGLT